MEQNQLKTRYAHIDLLECIAIFFVVLYHCSFYNFNFFEKASIINYFIYFFRCILSSCVPLFFFVNGYLLLNRPFVLKKHLLKMIRLVILTIVWSIILVLVSIPIRQERFSIKQIILLIVDMETPWTNILWFLCALFCIYIFFPLLKATFDNQKNAFAFFTIICAVLSLGISFGRELLSLFSIWVDLGRLNPFDTDLFNSFNPFKGMYSFSLFYFCFGGLFFKIQERILSINRKKRNVCAVLCLLISMCLLFFTGVFFSCSTNLIWNVVWEGYDTIFTLGIVISIFTLCLNYNKDNRFIETVSINTLGIYLVHILFIRTIEQMPFSSLLREIPLDIVVAVIVTIAPAL